MPMNERERAELLDKAIESIRANPFGEFAARTKWAPKERTETLLADIRRRLDSALAQDEADEAVDHANQLKKEQQHQLKEETSLLLSAGGRSLPRPPRLPVAHQKRERSPTTTVVTLVKESTLVKEEPSEQLGVASAAVASSNTTSFKNAIQAAKAKAALRAATVTAQVVGSAINADGVAQPNVELAHDSRASDYLPQPESTAGRTASSSSQQHFHQVQQQQPSSNLVVDDDDGDESFDVFIPEAVRSTMAASSSSSSGGITGSSGIHWTDSSRGRPSETSLSSTMMGVGGGSSSSSKHASQLTKDEYMQQFKRAPRRGEIGVTAEQVAEATSLGYVMSGSRNRASDKYVDRIQRQLHEKQASQLRLDFLKESDRRSEAATMDFLKGLLESKE